MDKLKLYPILLADPIQEYNKSKSTFYIFSSKNNRGYQLDGYAANLCHRFNGLKSLEEIVQEFEKEMDLGTGYFKDEINVLLHDLQSNALIEFHSSPQILKPN